MQIGVAILALVGGICELEICVTVPACNLGVPSAQGKAGLRVIKSDLGRKHLPVAHGVTCIAWHIQRPMRALSGSPRRHGLRI